MLNIFDVGSKQKLLEEDVQFKNGLIVRSSVANSQQPRSALYVAREQALTAQDTALSKQEHNWVFVAFPNVKLVRHCSGHLPPPGAQLVANVPLICANTAGPSEGAPWVARSSNAREIRKK
jgi:hypothetical protein